MRLFWNGTCSHPSIFSTSLPQFKLKKQYYSILILFHILQGFPNSLKEWGNRLSKRKWEILLEREFFNLVVGIWGRVILTIQTFYRAKNIHGNIKFEKLEITTKYIPNIIFECIAASIDKQLNLLHYKENIANDSICKILFCNWWCI